MRGDPVPDDNHILRYVGGSHVEQDEDGNPYVTGGGFIARPRDNNMPSYNWLEYLSGTLDERVQTVRKTARIKYRAKARLAKLHVGRVIKHVRDNTDDGRVVEVIHDPLDEVIHDPPDPLNDYPPDSSHSFMTNIPSEDDPEGETIGDLIAECVCNTFPARTSC